MARSICSVSCSCRQCARSRRWRRLHAAPPACATSTFAHIRAPVKLTHVWCVWCVWFYTTIQEECMTTKPGSQLAWTPRRYTARTVCRRSRKWALRTDETCHKLWRKCPLGKIIETCPPLCAPPAPNVSPDSSTLPS